jgi:hypothetical protein
LIKIKGIDLSDTTRVLPHLLLQRFFGIARPAAQAEGGLACRGEPGIENF